MQTYTIPEDLLQAAISLLAEMPALRTRTVLNALEAVCTKQDAERHNQEVENEVTARLNARVK